MLVGHLFRDLSGAAKLLDWLDYMIRRHDQHGRRGILSSNQRRSQSDASGRVSPHRLSDYMIRRHGPELADHFPGVHGCRDHPGVLRRNRTFDAIESLLEKGPVAGQAEELFGSFLPAPRPEARSTAPRHYQGM
jgi:hypothetical protein